MARNALKVKQAKLTVQRLKALAEGKKMKNSTKYYNRCQLCGRAGSYLRELGVCRVCLRKYAREGLIVGLKKASW
ncbi:type Z 30S ribosomal protein S14 [Patescibacteria group bacterium]|nr:type Z 30S ribosomal protein S14 [Patescibacteria group bacterium]